MEKNKSSLSISRDNKRIAKNTLALYFRMILTILITLYTSRVILNTLGVEDYGIYNVVGGIVTMFGFFNSAMSSSTQRFLSFALGKKDYVELRRTFNAALIVHIGISVLILILAETIGLWFVNSYLNIPPERMEAARWVYQFSILSFVLLIVQVPYSATIIAHERMNVYAYVAILEVSLKLLMVFILTWITTDKLKLYGILSFGVAFITTTIYKLYTWGRFSETKLMIVKDGKLYKTLISYSGWNLFGNIAAVAKGQGVNILYNIFFDPIVNAAQGIASQVRAASLGFVSNFQIAVNPQIIKTYASDQRAYMNLLIIRSAKFSFYLLFLLSMPIIIEIDTVLAFWLKTVPDYTALFTALILVNALVDCISGSLMTSIQATGEIKVYQAVEGSLIVLILPISYILFRMGYSPEVSIIVSIIISGIAFVFRLWLAKKLLYFPVRKYFKEVILRNIPLILISGPLLLVIRNQMTPSFFRLIIIILLSLSISGVLIYWIGFNKNERRMIKKAMRGIMVKIRNYRK